MRRGLLLSCLCRIKEVQMFITQKLNFSKAQEPDTQGKRLILALSVNAKINDRILLIL